MQQFPEPTFAPNLVLSSVVRIEEGHSQGFWVFNKASKQLNNREKVWSVIKTMGMNQLGR